MGITPNYYRRRSEEAKERETSGFYGLKRPETTDMRPLFFAHGRNRQTGLPQERHFLEHRILLKCSEGHRPFEDPERLNIHTNPTSIFCRWIRVSFTHHFDHTHDFLSRYRMVKKGKILETHCAQIVSGLKVSDAGPRLDAILHLVLP